MALLPSLSTSLLLSFLLPHFSLPIVYSPNSEAISLSLTLQHFFPFTARLVLDSKSCQPKLVYNPKHCYVSLTFAESVCDAEYFHHISGKHPRDVKELHPLVPWLQSGCLQQYHSSDDDNVNKDDFGLPLLAVKVTVFPPCGLCVGFAFHHVAADGRTLNHFIKTWASFQRDSSLLISSMRLPSYDRTVVIDKHGLEDIFLTEWRNKQGGLMGIGSESKLADGYFSSKDKVVRATFVMGLTDMENIKRWIIGECKNKNLAEPVHLSPYVLTCAFVWVGLVKALTHNCAGTAVDLYKYPCYFGFNAGGLTRFDCPVPATYFGNYIGFGRAEATMGGLMEENGIVVAAKAIGGTIKKLDKSFLEQAGRWISDWEVFFGSQFHIMVMGSPKVDLYETNFGWGRPNKIEEISIDRWDLGAICLSLTESRDEKGGIEVGLTLPRPQMDAFTSFFFQKLEKLASQNVRT